MDNLTRRSILRASLGMAAAGTFARPYIANAQAKTAQVWWVQGLVQAEDDAFKVTVADFEKQTGDKLDYSIVPFAPLRQKIISAVTSGVVPDLTIASPSEFLPLQAWEGRLLDVSDVVEPRKAKMWPAAVESAYCYNNKEKKHSFYGIPYHVSFTPFHIWGSLVEKAGYKMSDIPNKWDAFIDFFIPIQKKLQAQGMRHTYATGFVVSTIGNDPNNTINQFILAYGGRNIVSKDGKFNGSDPLVHEAVIKAVEKLTTLYKNGHIPPSSINWNDADDNNAFHSKLCVMDFDGTLSTELAMLRTKEGRDAYYHEVVTADLPLSNEGHPIPRQMGVGEMLIPKGAKNPEVAKEFAKFMIEPEVNEKNAKGGLGRFLPVEPELVKNDPWWNDIKRDPHVPPYVKIGAGGPLVQYFFTYNPAWAKVRSEHPFNIAFHDVIASGMTVKDAVAKAIKRIDQIFTEYRIQA
jgi:multiple sugar transport system substrate-binding protein